MATSVPPHNAAELLDAAILLIDQPKADDAAVLGHVKGPDFPTGGQIVDSPQAIAEAYATGRGRSEEHTSELQSLMRISYAVFCLKKKKKTHASHHAPHKLLTTESRQ